MSTLGCCLARGHESLLTDVVGVAAIGGRDIDQGGVAQLDREEVHARVVVPLLALYHLVLNQLLYKSSAFVQ